MRKGVPEAETEINEKGEFVESKGFFCSELIACLLQRLQLVDTDRPASYYWPGNFSNEAPASGIQLRDDAFYSEEFTLDL